MPFPTLGPNEVALAVTIPDPPAVALLPERAIPALGWDTKPAWLLDAPPLTRAMPTSTATRAATMSSRLENPLGGFNEIQSVPPGRAARPLAASSVAPISTDMDAPCVLPRERASHPDDERYSTKPSQKHFARPAACTIPRVAGVGRRLTGRTGAVGLALTAW